MHGVREHFSSTPGALTEEPRLFRIAKGGAPIQGGDDGS
jgi:hypothetical protein